MNTQAHNARIELAAQAKPGFVWPPFLSLCRQKTLFSSLTLVVLVAPRMQRSTLSVQCIRVHAIQPENATTTGKSSSQHRH